MKKDYFSAVSEKYRQGRSDYPNELFDYLATTTAQQTRMWDCGTGSGQVAVPMANFFGEVLATDLSQKQLDNAKQHPRVKYWQSTAESVDIENSSIDIVTSAQAAHWFDIKAFYKEVNRVLKPEGILAIWCYSLLSVNKDIDVFVQKLFGNILEPFWPKRTLADHTYTNIPFPFDELPKKDFKMTAHWNLNQFLAYFRSWSASHRYEQQNKVDPVSLVEGDFLQLWGNAEQSREVTWKIHLRHGKPLANN